MKTCPRCGGSGINREGENEFLCLQCNGWCEVEDTKLAYIILGILVVGVSIVSYLYFNIGY